MYKHKLLEYKIGDISENISQGQGISFQGRALTWNTAQDVRAVVKALTKKKVVHYLKLHGYALGVDAAAAIGKALEKHRALRQALWQNMFTGREKTEIPQVLQHLFKGLMVARAQLTVLDLSDNALGPNGMVALEDFLRSPVCYTLQVLRLNNCGLGIKGGRILATALLDCHCSSMAAGTHFKLKVFTAGSNRLENVGAMALAETFATIKTLKEIALPQNSIYHLGIAALAESFKLNPNMKILNLNDNTINNEGAQYLAEAFAFMPHLREVNIGDCVLTSSAAIHLAAALAEGHQKLKVVDLTFNEIGPVGGIILASLLGTKPNLQKLKLNGNHFGSAGRKCIKRSMELAANSQAVDDMQEDHSDVDEFDYDGEGVDREILQELYKFDIGHHIDKAKEPEKCDFNESAAEVTVYRTAQTECPRNSLKPKKRVSFADEVNESHKKQDTVHLSFNKIGSVCENNLGTKPNLQKLKMDGNQSVSPEGEYLKKSMKFSAKPQTLDDIPGYQSDVEMYDNDDESVENEILLKVHKYDNDNLIEIAEKFDKGNINDSAAGEAVNITAQTACCPTSSKSNKSISFAEERSESHNKLDTVHLNFNKIGSVCDTIMANPMGTKPDVQKRKFVSAGRKTFKQSMELVDNLQALDDMQEDQANVEKYDHVDQSVDREILKERQEFDLEQHIETFEESDKDSSNEDGAEVAVCPRAQSDCCATSFMPNKCVALSEEITENHHKPEELHLSFNTISLVSGIVVGPALLWMACTNVYGMLKSLLPQFTITNIVARK